MYGANFTRCIASFVSKQMVMLFYLLDFGLFGRALRWIRVNGIIAFHFDTTNYSDRDCDSGTRDHAGNKESIIWKERIQNDGAKQYSA